MRDRPPFRPHFEFNYETDFFPPPPITLNAKFRAKSCLTFDSSHPDNSLQNLISG